MTERADQLQHDNTPAHSTALVQVFYFVGAKHHITQVCQPPLQPRFGSLRLLAFPIAKIAVGREEICQCECHTNSVNCVSLPTDQPHGKVTVHEWRVRSSPTGCQVTPRPRDWISRYTKWLNTFRTALVHTHTHTHKHTHLTPAEWVVSCQIPEQTLEVTTIPLRETTFDGCPVHKAEF